MRLPLVPSLPGPDPVAALRRVLGDGPDAAPEPVGSGPAPRVGQQPTAAAAGRAADPRLAVPPFRVDRGRDAARNPALTAADVDDASNVTFVADPFVVRAGDPDSTTDGDDASDGGADGEDAEGATAADPPYYCFFEVKRRDRHPLFGLRGTEPRFDIGHATSCDGRDWTYEGVVLPAERAEHTYPHVLRHDGAWYMVPSPAGRTPNELRIYRATAFPEEWELVDTALSGEVRVDPTPFRYDGVWFLPYQAPAAAAHAVRLRWSDRLVGGEWREHPASPLFTPGGNDIAPGGRPLVRPEAGVVDLFFRRGGPGIVEAWRVVEPTPTDWSMRELPTSPVVAGSDAAGAWDERNVHHVDAGLAHTTASDLVLVDGQDADRRYRLGVARTGDFDAHLRADLDPTQVPPGARTALDVTAAVDPDGACHDGGVRTPGAGWYRAAVRLSVGVDGAGAGGGGTRDGTGVGVELELRAGEASAGGRFDAAGEGAGRVALGPVGLRADAPVGVAVRHDAPRPLRVTGGRLRLRGW